MFLSICLPEIFFFKKNMYLFSQMAEIKDKGARLQPACGLRYMQRSVLLQSIAKTIYKYHFSAGHGRSWEELTL